MLKLRNYLPKIVLILFLLILVVQRFYLVDISQWREDQATNYWLGETLKLNEFSVGLISSKEIPNPNGLILIGKFLSIINDFKFSIIIFSLIQLFIIYFFIQRVEIEGTKQIKQLLFLAIASSPYIVMSSFELWSQFLYITLNLLSLLLVFNSKDNNVNPIVLILFIFLLPSFYLAGLLNLLALLALVFFLFISKKKTIKVSGSPYINFVYLLVIIFVINYVWRPYFNAFNLDQLIGIVSEEKTRLDILSVIKKVFFNFSFEEPYLIQSDLSIYSITTLRLRTALKLFHLLLSIYFLLIFVTSTFLRLAGKNKKLSIDFYIPGLFIAFCYFLSPIIGGPNFILNERPDINLQFYPLYLIFIYMISNKLFEIKHIGKLLKQINSISLFVLFALNSLFLVNLYHDYKNYDGEILSNSDIPLIHKIKVVDYIYEDFKESKNDKTLKIYYDLGGDGFDWIPGFGEKLTPYYDAPYTLGRIFDLLFYKKYGLINEQEGVQLRSKENVDYILTYRDFPKVDYKLLPPVNEVIDINRFRILTFQNQNE